MISVRVNEILKYLSSDKKERLKRCVQIESSQKLDNTRMHRNNLANALSSLSVPVAAEAGRERLLGNGSSASSYQMPPALSESALEGEEEMKVKEKFQNYSGDKELHKDYKKRRPLAVLKSHNVQCLPNGHSSSPVIATSSSVLPNAPFIPSDHSSQAVKQLNGYKYVASTKSATKADPGPALSTEQLQLDPDSVKRETKSHKDTGPAHKGKSKQLENRQHSKQKTGSSLPITAETQAPVETISTKEHPVGNKQMSETETVDHQPPANAASPSCVSSRRSKKQNKHKEATYGKIPQQFDSPCHDLNKLLDNSSPELSNVIRKTFSNMQKTVEEYSGGRITTTQKDKKLEPVKSSCVLPSGYTSTSGVAELDTFEITSIRNQKLATKRVSADKRPVDHVQVSPVNKVNALDTFDEPLPRPLTRRSVQAPAVQKEREVDEKWIEVNRKIKRVVVPSGVVSRILGLNGSKLEAICQVTRAHIELEKTSNPNETIFVLRGTLEQMQAASNMISALIKDNKSSDCAKTGNIPQMKNDSPRHLLLQPVSTKPVSIAITKETKTNLKLGQSPVPSVTNNAVPERCSPPSVPQINGYSQNDDDYPESVPSSVSEQSDPCSERCSPAQDLLIGEYSLFEHGLGQPLEKLLARKDSSKQTFARAAANKTPSRTLTPIIPNHSAIDQVLLAKAPGYRSAKAIYARDSCFPRAPGFGSRVPNGRIGWPAFSGRGPERLKENDPSHSTASHLFGISSCSVHIPPVERPLSAPGFPLAHSSSSSPSAAVPATVACDRQAAPSDHVMATKTFSNLNPNAPDFVFTLPLEETSSRISGLPEQSGPHLDGVPADPSADNLGCMHADGSTSEFSYSVSQLGSGFEPITVELPDSASRGAVGRDVGFTLPGSGADEGMYMAPLSGDNLITPWLCSQGSWHPSKMPYGVGRGEQAMPGTTASASYPSRSELYRNYFTHPPFSPIASSPYNCAFYQQQNMMLAPVQSWSHAVQTLAQAGP